MALTSAMANQAQPAYTSAVSYGQGTYSQRQALLAMSHHQQNALAQQRLSNAILTNGPYQHAGQYMSGFGPGSLQRLQQGQQARQQNLIKNGHTFHVHVMPPMGPASASAPVNAQVGTIAITNNTGFTIATGTSSATTTGVYQWITTTSASTMRPVSYQEWDYARDQPYPLKLAKSSEYEMPDGSTLAIDRLGNFKVTDVAEKVKYLANTVREFNPYINASDLLENFIKDVGAMGVKQGELLQLPVNAFIHWLILQAAKRDGDPLDNLPSVQAALPAGVMA